MKKNTKLVVAFLLGAIIFGSIGVLATSQIMSSNVIYNNTTVDLALDELYNSAYDFDNSTSNFNASHGTNVSRSTSLNLSAGTYLVYANIVQEGSSGSASTSNKGNYTVNLNYNHDNGECKYLSGNRLFSAASSVFISQYLWHNLWYSTYLCSFSQETSVSVSNYQTGTYTETTSSVFLDAIKIK